LIATLPLLIQLFGGASSASVGFWDKSNWGAWLATVAAALLAGVLLYAAIPLISLGLSRTATTAMALGPLLFGTFGVYQTGLLVWIGVGMLAFAKIWRIGLTEALTAMFAAIAGASLGVMALLIEFNASDVVVVINPLEEMITFADPSATSAVDSGNLLAAFGLLVSGVTGVLERYTFVLFTSPRPTVFLTWLIFPRHCLCVAARRKAGCRTGGTAHVMCNRN
jgi:hypothetical protein